MGAHCPADGERMRTIAIITVLAVLLLAACAPKAMPAAPAPTATDNVVADVGGDVADVGGLTQDLDTSDLNSLDQELADIDNLELQ